MLALYVALWSLATMSMGLVNGLAAIFFVRFLLGISQAGAYPTAASLLKRWFPYGSRGRANSSVSMGGRAGGLLAFAVTPALMLLVGAGSDGRRAVGAWCSHSMEHWAWGGWSFLSGSIATLLANIPGATSKRSS